MSSSKDRDEELILMAESIENYRSDLKRERVKNRKLEDRLRFWGGLTRVRDLAIWVAGTLVAGLALVWFGYAFFSWIEAPHDSNVCTVTRVGQNSSKSPCPCYQLRKSLDWRLDSSLGYFPTVEAAAAEAKVLGCTTNINSQ